MKYSSNKFSLAHIFRFRTVLTDEALRQEFSREVRFINLTRLRIFGYFVVALVLFQLYSDFFLGDFWDTRQISLFMYLDVGLGIWNILVLLLIHINRPKKPSDTKKWHGLIVHMFVLIQVLWSAGISVIENSSASGLPTYLLGVFAAAIIFILPGIPFLIYLTASVATIIIGLLETGMSSEQMVVNYAPLIVLIIIAWLTSRILFNTRVKSFYDTKNLEIARNNLDKTVKERTIELRDANAKLKEEILERMSYERRLEIEKTKAEESDRLKSAFLANMSHEIRTPLNGLLGFAELLKNQDLPAEKKDRYFDIINSNGEQLVRIIDDIMDISMIESNQLKLNSSCFSMSQIMNDAYTNFSNYLLTHDKENIDLILECIDKSVNDQVYSDISRVQQVVYNLLSNAMKFTKKGHIRFGAKYDSGFIMVFVEDTGIGIDPSKCETIFERFRQGEESISRSYGGTGLGLSISKGIIEMLGGMIWIDFAYTQGARFCFSLPTIEIEDALNAIDKSRLKGLLSARDLIVTNEQNGEQSVLNYFLKCTKSDISVEDASVFSINRLHPEPEILIVDLPGNAPLNKEICAKLNTHLSRTRVISIYNEKVDIKKDLLDLGCTAVFTEPLNIQLLLHHIKKISINNNQGR